MNRLMCKVQAWRIPPAEDDQWAAEVRVDIWIEGGSRCGRIAGTIIEHATDGPPHRREFERDDFHLAPDIRDALLVEGYLLIGRMPDHVDGSASDPFDFQPWIGERWSKLRARVLAGILEGTIRENVAEPQASGGVNEKEEQ